MRLRGIGGRGRGSGAGISHHQRHYLGQWSSNHLPSESPGAMSKYKMLVPPEVPVPESWVWPENFYSEYKLLMLPPSVPMSDIGRKTAHDHSGHGPEDRTGAGLLSS